MLSIKTCNTATQMFCCYDEQLTAILEDVCVKKWKIRNTDNEQIRDE